MSRWYLDSSAALKLLVSEAESATLAERLDTVVPALVAGWPLETELRRAVARYDQLDQTRVTRLLQRVDQFEIPRTAYRDAGLLPGTHLRSLDAIHLATAIRLGADAVLTYDHRMAAAAESLGLPVVSPGRDGGTQ